MAGYKYHALLTEPVWLLRKQLTTDDVMVQGERAAEDFIGEYETRVMRGVYGFYTIELRDKFIRRCNNAADDPTAKVCLAVTVPNLYTDKPYETVIRATPTVTAPVTNT